MDEVLRVAYNPDIEIMPVKGLMKIMYFKEDETHGERWGVCVFAKLKKGSQEFEGHHWWPLRFFEDAEDAKKILKLCDEGTLEADDVESFVL